MASVNDTIDASISDTPSRIGALPIAVALTISAGRCTGSTSSPAKPPNGAVV